VCCTWEGHCKRFWWTPSLYQRFLSLSKYLLNILQARKREKKLRLILVRQNWRSYSFLGGTSVAGSSTMVPGVPWAGVAGIGSIDGNPGIIPDTVGTISLIFRGRIRIFPAHWRSRFAAPPALFGFDLSCNRK